MFLQQQWELSSRSTENWVASRKASSAHTSGGFRCCRGFQGSAATSGSGGRERGGGGGEPNGAGGKDKQGTSEEI